MSDIKEINNEAEQSEQNQVAATNSTENAVQASEVQPVEASPNENVELSEEKAKQEEKEDEQLDSEQDASVEANSAEAVTDEAVASDVPVVTEGVQSDVVADAELIQPTDYAAMISNPYIIGGALAGIGLGLSTGDDDKIVNNNTGGGSTPAVPDPIVNDISGDNVVNGYSSLIINGGADPESTVTIMIGEQTFTTTASATGGFSLELTAEQVASIGEGEFTVSVSSANNGERQSETVTKTITIDTTFPTSVTEIDDNALTFGETATVTFTFSEEVVGFTVDDLEVVGGSVSNLQGSGTVYTATFTPDVDTEISDASIKITNGAFTDVAGNRGAASIVKDISIDTVKPTVTVSADATSFGKEGTTTVTFTFSEDPGTAFSLEDVTVIGGSLTSLTGTGLTRSATFTVESDFQGEGSITVSNAAYTDAAGNANDSSVLSGLTIDTKDPLITVDSFSVAENTTTVGTLTADEAVTFTIAAGDDGALFSIEDGVLSFSEAKDFETDSATYTVNVTATDVNGYSSTQAVNITLTDVNEAPTATAIDSQVIAVNTAASIDLSANFTDVDSDTLTFTLDGTLPEGLSLSTAGVLSGTATATAASSEFTITATDGELSVSQTFSLSVVNAPVLTTDLSLIGDNVLDVRSHIVLKVDQDIEAVSGKNITLTEASDVTGYQGETQLNSFTIAADSDLVTIDNDKGLIIIDVDANFDLDLASSYTLSVDDGAFLGTSTNQPSVAFDPVTFDTVIPVSGADTLGTLGQVDTDASIQNYLPVFLASDAGQAFASFGDSIKLQAASDAYNELTSTEKSEYEVLSTGAVAHMMSVTDGSLEAGQEWVSIEGLGIGSATTTNSATDGAVFALDASTSSYVFTFSDKDETNLVKTATDFAVFIDEFGADDNIYIDDAFNDVINDLSAAGVFAFGNGDEGSELFAGLVTADGDPRLIVGLEGDTVSEDNGIADPSVEGVSDALGLDDGTIAVITA